MKAESQRLGTCGSAKYQPRILAEEEAAAANYVNTASSRQKTFATFGDPRRWIGERGGGEGERRKERGEARGNGEP